MVLKSNVLVDEEGRPRISDFGLVRIEDSLASVTASSFNGRGSLRWQAPELLCPDQFPDIPCNITTKSDVYSFACLCLEVRYSGLGTMLMRWIQHSQIFTGYPPFPHLREISVLNEIAILDRRPARPAYCFPLGLDDEMWALMQWCWRRHPAVRPTMQAVQTVLQRLSMGTVNISEHQAPYRCTSDSPVQFRHDGLAFSRRMHLPHETQIAKTSARCAELWTKLAPHHERIGPSLEHSTECVSTESPVVRS